MPPGNTQGRGFWRRRGVDPACWLLHTWLEAQSCGAAGASLPALPRQPQRGQRAGMGQWPSLPWGCLMKPRPAARRGSCPADKEGTVCPATKAAWQAAHAGRIEGLKWDRQTGLPRILLLSLLPPLCAQGDVVPRDAVCNWGAWQSQGSCFSFSCSRALCLLKYQSCPALQRASPPLQSNPFPGDSSDLPVGSLYLSHCPP